MAAVLPGASTRSASEDASEASVAKLDFRSIYDEHVDFVFRCARRMGVHERLLDDCVQDVFLVVHRRLADFEGRSKLKTWLYGIARRVSKDYRRRAARKEQGWVSDEGLVADEQSPAEQAARREAWNTLEKLLQSLDDNKREVFVLAEMEEMSVPEIAEALDLNLNTAYSRLRVARSQFEAAATRFRKQSEGPTAGDEAASEEARR